LKPRILVFSTFYGLPSFTKASMKNHLSYCLKHGYDYIPDFLKKPTIRQFSWAKLQLALIHLRSKKYDAIFWMDADSFFLNSNIKLECFLDLDQIPIHFSGDENDIFNGGHFLLRDHPESLAWVQECWRICEIQEPRIVTTHKDDHHLFDQPGILALLGGADPSDPSTWADGFNSVNGFPDNPYRRHKNFQDTYAPSNPSNCEAARSLICDRWRPYCYVHPQRTMNSYPWSMGADDFIVHFVGNTKHLMEEWHARFNFYPS